MVNELLLSNLSLSLYALAAVLYLMGSRTHGAKVAVGSAAFVAFVLATVLLTVGFGMVIGADRRPPSGFLLVLVIGWLTIMSRGYLQVKPLGAFVAPLATLVLLLELFSTNANPVATQSPSAVLAGVHITMAILGDAFAILAAGLSVFYLIQQTHLKKKHLHQLSDDLPSLMKLDRLLSYCLWTGFIFITVALLTGTIYTQLYVEKRGLGLELKIIWAIAVWLWYLATLLSRNVFNHSGRRLAQMALGGFLLISIAWYGLRGVLKNGQLLGATQRATEGIQLAALVMGV